MMKVAMLSQLFSPPMTNQIILALSRSQSKKLPDIRPGYTLRVHERIKEGDKERVQIFEGLVISVHKGHVPSDASFTVRRVVSGVAVEKVFPFQSPVLEKIEVKKVADVRRAKLTFLRKRTGKSARMTERFTTGGEFDVVADVVAEQSTTAEPEVIEKVEESEKAPAA
jgi:large subunit ribosomal protein L19